MQQGRYDLAISEIESVLAENADDHLGHYLRAICLIHLDELSKAEEAAKQIIALAPHGPYGFHALSLVQFKKKNYRESLKAIETAIELDPEDENYWLQKGGIQEATYRWKEAIESTDRALSINAEYAEALMLRSHALHALGRTVEAKAAAEAALEIDPNLAMAHFEQGWALLRSGKSRAAEERFLEALRIDPDLTAAQDGLKEAIRSRFAPYRWITGYQHWLRRFSPKVGVALMVGAVLAINLLPRIVSPLSVLYPIALLLVFLYLIFAYLTWIARPLANFFLRFHPLGKHALTLDEQNGTLVLGSVFTLAILFSTIWVNPPGLYWSGVIMCLGLAIPATAVYQANPGQTRWLMAAIAIGLLVMGPVSHLCYVFLPAIPGDSVLGSFIIFGLRNFWTGVAVSSWVSIGNSVRDS